jgi:hypothetical protein
MRVTTQHGGIGTINAERSQFAGTRVNGARVIQVCEPDLRIVMVLAREGPGPYK